MKNQATPIQIKNIINVLSIAAISAVIVIQIILVNFRLPNPGLSDVAIYRGGAELFWNNSLYDVAFPVAGYWTYPPFGALVFTPLMWIPENLVFMSWLILSTFMLSIVIYLGFKETPIINNVLNKYGECASLSCRTKLWVSTFLVLAGLTFFSLSLGPVFHHLLFGQIGLFLATLVSLDFFVVRKRFPKWYGYLTGVAAAIKLTPFAFVGLLLFIGHYRAFLKACLSILTAWGIAAMLNWKATLQYFFEGRLANLTAEMNEYTNVFLYSNQSLLGFIARRTLKPESYDISILGGTVEYQFIVDLTKWYMVLAALLGLLSLYFAKKLYKNQDTLAAVALVGISTAILSPYAWMHHHIWILLGFAVILRNITTLKLAFLALTSVFWTTAPVGGSILIPHVPELLQTILWESTFIIDIVLWLFLVLLSFRDNKNLKVKNIPEAFNN